MVRLLVFTCLIGIAPVIADAQKPATSIEEQQFEATDQVIRDFALASQLIEVGRKNKAPEALVTAAGLFRKLAKVEMATVEDEPVIENDPQNAKNSAAAKDEAADFGQLAGDLFSEAIFMGKKDNLNLASLVDQAKARAEYRAPVGGPRKVQRAITPGQTHSYTFKIVKREPVSLAFRSNAPCKVAAKRNDSDQVYQNGIGMFGNGRLTTGGLKVKKANVNIRIHNYSNISGAYVLLVN